MKLMLGNYIHDCAVEIYKLQCSCISYWEASVLWGKRYSYL